MIDNQHSPEISPKPHDPEIPIPYNEPTEGSVDIPSEIPPSGTPSEIPSPEEYKLKEINPKDDGFDASTRRQPTDSVLAPVQPIVDGDPIFSPRGDHSDYPGEDKSNMDDDTESDDADSDRT